MHWDDPEEWNGEGGGLGVQDGEYMYISWRIQVNEWQNQYNVVKKKKKWAEVKQDLVSLSHNKIKLSWNAVFDKRLCEFLWL